MNQIKVRVVSGYFEPKTCANLITAMSNVPGDSISALAFFETLTSIYDEMQGEALRPSLLQAMLRKTLRSPILFDTTMTFLIDTECFEGMQVLSRKYPFSEEYQVAIIGKLG